MVDIIDKALRMGEGHQLKKLENVAKAVNALEDEISALSDEDLKAQTPKFKQEIENGKSLDEIMPEAFATVREVSKRTLGPAPLRRAAHGRRRSALGQHRRNEDR